jgi:23S rRNA (adenine2030-N6)-methyltransferase
VFAIWYPLTDRAATAPLFLALREKHLAPVLTVELRVHGESAAAGMGGCGMAILNPPWQFDAEVRPLIEYMERVLALDAGAAGQLDWLVPETP